MPTRVLIADPDKYLLTVFQERLWQEVFEAATAGDGLQCAAMLEEFSPDVLVLDPTIAWGGGDGIVAMIHQDSRVKKVPLIILLTYGCSPAVLYNISPFPIADYLIKPISGNRLAQRIRLALARRASEAPASARGEGGAR